jgi:centrosomal protein CEP104
MYLEFYGNPITIKPENFLKGLSDKNLIEKEREENEYKNLDDISKEKIRILKSHMESAVKNEDFDEAKRLKNNIATIIEYSKQLIQLEKNKKMFVDMQDFDSAKIYKMEIDKLKSKYKTIDKQIKELNFVTNANHNNTIDLNKSLGITNILEESKENKEKFLIMNNLGNNNNNLNFVNNANHNNTIDLNKSLGITNILEESKENKEKFLIMNNLGNNNNNLNFVNKSFAFDKDKETYEKNNIIIIIIYLY